MTATVAGPTTTPPRVDAAPAEPRLRRRLRAATGRSGWLVFAVALATRLTVILRHGGIDGLFGYDAGVYFAGADSLVHGRLPYADYVQLHPPGITVALTPFALLTHVLSDSTAFTVAIFAFVVLGAVNAVLVTRVCLALGLGRAAATAGGLLYALWMGAVGAEFLIKLEPLGNALVLAGLLLALRAERRPTVRWPSVLAGVPLGLAVSVKIWWIVPVVAIMAWHGGRSRSVRRCGAMAAGAAAAAFAVNLPFFLAAPGRMWSMVVVDQVGRKRGISLVARLQDLSGVSYLHESTGVAHALLAAFAAVSMLAALAAWRVRAARPAVVLVALQLLVVLAAPSWFPYYGDYLAISVSVVIGAALCARNGWAARSVALVCLAATGALTTTALASGAAHANPFRGAAALARTVAGVRCVMTDSPAVQIRLDVLSRGLAAGCPNWIDVTGPTYGPYRSSASRAGNPRWQQAFLAYLERGQAIILVRGTATGATPALHARLAHGGTLASVGGWTVYRGGGPG